MNNGIVRKIDFVGVGAMRCGTTWIWQCLIEHPQICSIPKKEVNFFREDGYENRVDQYLANFSHCSIGALRGEFTPSYINRLDCAERIKRFFPDVKIIICLRDPIDRAYDQYWHQKTQGFKQPSFDEVARLKEESKLIRSGLYYERVKQFLDIFPREHISISFHSDIAKDPTAFMKRIYRFLGVDDNFIAPSVNKIVFGKQEVYGLGWKQWLRIKTFGILRRLGLSNLKTKKWFLKDPIDKVRTPSLKKSRRRRPLNRPPVSPETRKFLQDFYREDIKKLEKLVSQDLSSWLK